VVGSGTCTTKMQQMVESQLVGHQVLFRERIYMQWEQNWKLGPVWNFCIVIQCSRMNAETCYPL